VALSEIEKSRWIAAYLAQIAAKRRLELANHALISPT